VGPIAGVDEVEKRKQQLGEMVNIFVIPEEVGALIF
jgi:hypothetical protein